ncbi:MAG TPA: SGNH/GDSL hydrolase family protein [Chthoniobacteraceae bacterium]|nr:lipolytic protein family [Chthoniobacter sp.]HEV7867453.1 SGNH/GDSL hydrolase family protein [Chthoniobacteraceae bacterium]
MRLSLLCFASLLLLRVPCLVADEAPPTGFAKWEKEIAAFESADQRNPPPANGIVFVGSSSIRMWTTLAKDFPEHRVLNRGFGGSQIADALHFADRIIVPYQPRMVVLYSGGNDIAAGKSAEQVIADLKAFVAKVRTALPKAEIAYISVAGNPKRWAQLEKIKAVNAAAEAILKEQPGGKFINVFPHMLGEDGLPKPHIFLDDQLHMNAEGYKIWAEVVRPHLPPPDRQP